MSRRPALLPLLLLLLALAPASLRAAPAIDPATAARANEAVAAARAAFERGDYPTAIDRFEAALALRPAPKIYYNLGVCHTRLYRAANSDAASPHAAAAIDAFNTYLRAAPGAADREAVEDMVRALGGTPATQPQLRDPLRPAPIADPTPVEDPLADRPLEAIPTAIAAPATTTPPAIATPTPVAAPPLSRGYLGAQIGLVGQPQLLTRAGLDGAYQGLLALRGGARLGARRRFELGAQLWFGFPGQTAADNLALSTQVLQLDLGHAVSLGSRRRLELSFGGFVGAVREALRARPGQALPACAIQSAGTLVGARAGGVVGGRLGFAVLVGARRNHELGMHLNFALHGYGRGPISTGEAGCDERVLQDVPRARFVWSSALGYAFRF